MDYSVHGPDADNSFQIKYDANGNILSLVNQGWKAGTGNAYIDALHYSYLTNSNKLQAVVDDYNDPNSKLGDLHYNTATKTSTDYTYDANGNLVREIRYDVTGIAIPADPASALAVALHRVSQSKYDILDRPIEHIDPAGKSSFTAYDSAGRVLTTTDELLRVTTNSYDMAGRLTQVTMPDADGSGATTTDIPIIKYGYDYNGNQTSITDPSNYITSYEYDFLNRKTKATLPDPDLNGPTNPGPDGNGPQVSPVNLYFYDVAGNLSSTVDALGRASYTVYDQMNRVRKQVVSAPTATSANPTTQFDFSYTLTGLLTTDTDALGQKTQRQYDLLGRLQTLKLADPASGLISAGSPTTNYTYDRNRQATVTDALGHVTAYVYDTADKVLQEKKPDAVTGLTTANSPTTVYVFDALGQRTSVTDPLGNLTSYQYDLLGRKITETLPDPDGAGPLASPIVRYTYDDVSNLKTTTDALNQVTTYDYDNLNRKSKEKLADPITGTTTVNSPTTTFNYDVSGNVITVTDPLNQITAYEYDAINRKVKEKRPDPVTGGTTGNSPTTTWLCSRATTCTPGAWSGSVIRPDPRYFSIRSASIWAQDHPLRLYATRNHAG